MPKERIDAGEIHLEGKILNYVSINEIKQSKNSAAIKTISNYKICTFFRGKHWMFWCFKLEISFGISSTFPLFVRQQLLLRQKLLSLQMHWMTKEFDRILKRHFLTFVCACNTPLHYLEKRQQKFCESTPNAICTLFDPELIYARVTKTLSWRLLQSSGLCSLL